MLFLKKKKNMIKTNITISNLDALDKQIQYVQKMEKMKTDNSFQKFIQKKCLETLNRVMNERLIGGTTNDEEIDLYKTSNHLEETDNGFIIYNNAKISTDNYEDYPNGEFSIALAFEYGVGITGEGTYDDDIFTPWEYNINKYNFGWYYKKGEEKHHTYGYMGFEIYRYTTIEIKKKLNSWVNEYFNKKVV